MNRAAMNRLSIRHKFIAAILLTVVAALLVASTATLVYNLRNYRQNLLDDLSAQAALLGRASTPALQFDDPKSAREYLALLVERPHIDAAAIYNARGVLFASYRRDGKASLPPLPELDGSRVVGDTLVLFRRIVANNEILGTVYLQVQYRLYETLLINLGIALAVFALALVVAFSLSLWLQASVTRPILAVTGLARRVVEDKDYSLRAERTTEDEIGYLVDSINAMLSEVEARNQALEDSNRRLAAQIEERTEAEQALRASEQRVLQLNVELEQRVKERTLQLENSNRELEAFSYSVSHDLRTPLRAIDGFSQALLEDYHDKLDATGRDYLTRVRAGAQRMGTLIDDMLKLSRVTRAELRLEEVSLSELADEVLRELREDQPTRAVDCRITSGLEVRCDRHLMHIALHNLFNNAWKYTAKQAQPRIEFGMRPQRGEAVFFVQDNGVGFDMTYANKLFGAFQRLHDPMEFSGTGIGLATVKRIIGRHGGRVWAEAEVDKGAVFYFTLPTLAVPNGARPAASAKEAKHDRPTYLAG